MNTYKTIATAALLALGCSGAALARGGSGGSITPVSAPTPLGWVFPALDNAPAQPVDSAAPLLISGIQDRAVTYAFFAMDTKLVTVSAQMSKLTTQMAPYYQPCRVLADLNATGIKCGGGLVQFGPNELYTYSLESNLAKLPFPSLDKGVKQTFSANFIAPYAGLPGSAARDQLHIHFGEPVSQFLMHMDLGTSGAPSIGGIQFYAMNGAELLGKSEVKLLDQSADGLTPYVGVQLASGFTDLIVVGLDDPNNAYITDSAKAFGADLFSVLPKRNFVNY